MAEPTESPRAAQGGNKALFGGHRGGKKGAKKPSKLLRDMRWVYEHVDESQDVTQGRKICRGLLKDDPQKFVSQLQAMEREHRSGGPKREQAVAAKEAEAAGAVASADEGTVGVLELIDRLLGEGK